MIEGAHHDGNEYAWHPDGADVHPALLAGWIAGVVVVLGMVGWLLL